MSRTALGFLCLAGLLTLLLWRSGLQAQPPAMRPTVASPLQSSLITHVSDSPAGQQLTVIDTSSRALAIYLIEKTTGRVTLKSVRQLHWDLQLEEFNGVSPTPREIQSLLSR